MPTQEIQTSKPRGFTLSIDNGGTFTDGVLSDGDRLFSVKVLTTPHDLTIAFRQVLEQAAEQAGATVVELLKQTTCVRYSTTIGTNAIIQRSGPKLGLIVSRKDEVAFQGLAAESLLGDILDPTAKWVRGLEVDAGVDEAAVLVAAEELLNEGAERLVIALSGADAAASERQVKSILLSEYPRHILGALPMLFSTEVTGDPDIARRAATAVLNAYLHPALEHFLYKAEDVLRSSRYNRPLFIFGNDATTNRVAKVTAIKTYNSGPTGGVEGSVYLAGQYGIADLVSVDIGGTSSDIAFIHDARADGAANGQVEDVEVSMPLRDIHALGAGGGTIAKVESGQLVLGPESAGAAPGPAAFGFGGDRPTLTDANVVTGTLGPDAVLAGRIRLDSGRARRAVDERVAHPLGLSVEDAAVRIVEGIEKRIGDYIAGEFDRRGRSPEGATLLAFGGAGPMHVCAIANIAGIRKVLVPSLASVYSAFGIGTSDVVHAYQGMLNGDAGVLDALERRALIDMKGEGFGAAGVTLSWSRPGDGAETSYDKEGLLSALSGKGRKQTEAIVLTATASLPKVGFPTIGGSGVVEPKGSRTVTWKEGGAQETEIYDADAVLAAAGALSGPVIVEACDTTIVVPAGWHLSVDGHGQFVLTRAA